MKSSVRSEGRSAQKMARDLLVASALFVVVMGNFPCALGSRNHVNSSSTKEMCNSNDTCVLCLVKMETNLTKTISKTKGAHDTNYSRSLCLPKVQPNATSRSQTVVSQTTIDHRLSVVYIFIIILSAIGYGLLLPALLFQKKPSLIFIISLSFSDMFLAFVVMPMRVDIVLGASWIREPNLCRLSRCMSMFGMLPSIYGHVAISLDRLLSIKYAFWYKMNVTKYRVASVCIAIWIFSLFAYLPLFGVGATLSRPPTSSCAFHKVLSIDYLIAYLAIGFIAPSTVIIVAQVFLAFFIHKYMKRRRVQIFDMNLARTKANEMTRMKQEIRLQIMCLAIILVFFSCWIPVIRGTILSIIDPGSITPSVVFVNGVMLFCSCFLNPLILIVGSTDIRRKVIRRFRKCIMGKQKPQTDS